MMGKYFFHVSDGSFEIDPDGMEFSNWHGATAYALKRAGEAVVERGLDFWQGEHMRIIVTDQDGTTLFELRLSGHLPVEQGVLVPGVSDTMN